MADLLVRDVDEFTKQWLAERAVKNKRSQSAEARAILDEAAQNDLGKNTNPFLAFHEACKATGGIELELPERHPAQLADIWWLNEASHEAKGASS